MSSPNLLTALARAYMARERHRLGIDKADLATQAASDESMLRQAEAKRTLASIPTPEEDQAKLDLLRSQSEMYRQHGNYYGTPKTGTAASVKPALDENGNVVGFYGTKPDASGKIQFYSVDDIQRAGQAATTAPTPQPPNTATGTNTATVDTPPASPTTPPPPSPPPTSPVPSFRTAPKPQPKAPPKPERPITVNTKDENGDPFTTFITPDQARAIAQAGGLSGVKKNGIVKPLTGDAETRRVTSQAILGTVQGINAMLDDPEVRANLGPVAGRMLQGEKFVGNMSPKLADLYGQIHGFAMASYSAHGYRSAQDMERTMVQDLGPRFTADTLKAAIHGLSAFPQERVNLARPGGAASPPPTPPPPETRIINGVPYVKVPGGWKRQ